MVVCQTTATSGIYRDRQVFVAFDEAVCRLFRAGVGGVKLGCHIDDGCPPRKPFHRIGSWRCDDMSQNRHGLYMIDRFKRCHLSSLGYPSFPYHSFQVYTHHRSHAIKVYFSLAPSKSLDQILHHQHHIPNVSCNANNHFARVRCIGNEKRGHQRL
jgi:hypothetical protein